MAAKLANMPHGGDRKSDQAANLPLDSISQSSAADLLNVSDRSVRSAKKVLENGATELKTAVESGRLSVSVAATIAETPKAQQREVVARGQTLHQFGAMSQDTLPMSAKGLRQ